MDERTPIVCRNYFPNIDPLRFSCDIGRVADALLLFARITILSEDLTELIGLVSWMKEPLLRGYLADGTLRFALVQLHVDVSTDRYRMF